jgi:hypothetical protein
VGFVDYRYQVRSQALVDVIATIVQRPERQQAFLMSLVFVHHPLTKEESMDKVAVKLQSLYRAKVGRMATVDMLLRQRKLLSLPGTVQGKSGWYENKNESGGRCCMKYDLSGDGVWLQIGTEVTKEEWKAESRKAAGLSQGGQLLGLMGGGDSVRATDATNAMSAAGPGAAARLDALGLTETDTAPTTQLRSRMQPEGRAPWVQSPEHAASPAGVHSIIVQQTGQQAPREHQNCQEPKQDDRSGMYSPILASKRVRKVISYGTSVQVGDSSNTNNSESSSSGGGGVGGLPARDKDCLQLALLDSFIRRADKAARRLACKPGRVARRVARAQTTKVKQRKPKSKKGRKQGIPAPYTEVVLMEREKEGSRPHAPVPGAWA